MNSDEKSIFMEYKDNLNYILSTPSIIYGTNMNISIVDIGEEYSKIATRNSLFQLVGRAGRKGKKSNSAMVIFRTWDMLEKIMAPTYENIEAKIIENQFHSI
jgi:late competence protein required for DNA uptake (superfamily II DNA/RNA helicase)